MTVNIPQRVSTREANTSRVRASAVLDVNLEARDVRLRVASTGVKGNDLRADKVVAGSQGLGNSKGALAAVGVEDLSAPGSGRAAVAILGDLEPRSAGCGLGVRDLGHVNYHGAIVVSSNGLVGAGSLERLSVHLDGQAATG
jgi:hypothetical protein